jgi:hypothetical protein
MVCDKFISYIADILSSAFFMFLWYSNLEMMPNSITVNLNKLVITGGIVITMG